MEPPSSILTDNKMTTDNSDDPLPNFMYRISGLPTGNDRTGGLSYPGAKTK